MTLLDFPDFVVFWNSPGGPSDMSQTPTQAFFCAQFTISTLIRFSEKLGFHILELGFGKFATEFYQNHRNLTNFPQNSTKCCGKKGFWKISELGFWLRTGFFRNLAIWVFRNPELGFSVLHKKKPAQHQNQLHPGDPLV